jgi:DNA-binding GntR family transcriptional regulator
LVAEHDEFINALEAKDLARLDDLAQRHISYSKDLYLLHIQTREAMAANHSDT